MEDESLYTRNQSKEISEGLQHFIDSMVEEIVLEGKPFDSQKKYLKKFSENEGLDYDKLEANITTLLEILGNLNTSSSEHLTKLAGEKGMECRISEDVVKKLVEHSSLPPQKKQGRALLWGGIVLLPLVVILPLFLWLTGYYDSDMSNWEDEITPVEEEINSPILETDVKEVPKTTEFQIREISMAEERDCSTLDVSIEFPVMGNEDLLKVIREFINTTLSSELGVGLYDGDISDGSKMLEHYYKDVASNPNNELEVEFEVAYETCNMVTYDYSIDFYEHGAAHGSDSFGGATFRKSDGMRIDWGMFMNDGNMQAEIKKGMENYYGEGNYHRDYTPFPKGCPILLEDAVKFVYKRNELGTSYAEGSSFFSVPYSNIRDQMKSTVRDLIEEKD